MSNEAQSQTQAVYSPVVLMVLLAHPIELSRSVLEHYLGGNQANARNSIQAGQNNAYIVQRDGMVFSLIQVDKLIPKPTFETALRTSYGLEKGEALVDTHQAHLIVSPLSPSDDPGKTIGLSVTAMQLAATLVKHGEVLVCFWSNAELLGSVQVDAAVCENILLSEDAIGDEHTGLIYRVLFKLKINKLLVEN